MLRSIFKFFGSPVETEEVMPKEAHDPMDWKPGKTASGWTHERFFCPQCHASIGHNEFMSDVCYTCGFKAGPFRRFNSRSYRRLWDGEKWVWQYKWGNGDTQYRLSEKRLHS